MFKKGNKIYSVLTGTCPKCHQECMYRQRNPYHLTSVYDMYDTCSFCEFKFKIEPSFFFGAMYVSYALGIAFSMAAFIISYLIFDTSLLTSFFIIIGTLIMLMPVIMRLARNIWINFFVNYNPDSAFDSVKSGALK